MDMAEYLEAEEIRRQADTVVRLTVVTILGLVGTMTSGLLGMNIFNLAEASVSQKFVYFLAIFVPVGSLTFYTVIKSKRLSLFLDALSDEKMKPLKKLLMLKNVWSGKLHE
jgi:Mg2+ and Co2+ transporter CorA